MLFCCLADKVSMTAKLCLIDKIRLEKDKRFIHQVHAEVQESSMQTASHWYSKAALLQMIDDGFDVITMLPDPKNPLVAPLIPGDKVFVCPIDGNRYLKTHRNDLPEDCLEGVPLD
jgi:Holliday junction resolvase-like predicted endonuclease